MAEIKDKEDKIIINYCRPKSRKQRTFNLVFPYLNDNEIALTLVVEQRSSGNWKPVRQLLT
ncbi:MULTISPECIES: hypothetical protein [Caldanaerobacter]|uniref:Uncharacterized protein n=2 Tax=Caldanaerobacter subterraneus TaxID=911092 RepID=U5CQT4_CALSX|nr:MULTISPECIES: hypothetical protein [Caldanaerobacter]ERM91311.1 hypothetical protein O163_11125 [Caldanaerobacter subterraneus subsp. yonseiensis KB-1]MDI3518005.1 hypothetical protein [Caldanaerobacter sp.]TCO67931.1 hypothetical protein EV203_10414 [Caldanaerobacter subterraneus]